jgi:hypothetical protein
MSSSDYERLVTALEAVAADARARGAHGTAWDRPMGPHGTDPGWARAYRTSATSAIGGRAIRKEPWSASGAGRACENRGRPTWVGLLVGRSASGAGRACENRGRPTWVGLLVGLRRLSVTAPSFARAR